MSRSGYEETIKKSLKKLSKKVFWWYEPTKVPYVTPPKPCNYIPDFVIYKGRVKKPKKPLTTRDLKDTILVEAKGRFTKEDRAKMLLVKEQNPKLDIRILFQGNNYLTSLTKIQKQKLKDKKPFKKDRYGDWCDAHGFIWAVGEEIPKEWLKEIRQKEKNL